MAFGLSAGAAALVGSVAAPIVGGLMGSDAASDGYAAQEAGAARSDATQRYMYDTTRADNAPFLRNGTQASNRLAYFMGLGGTGPNQPDVETFLRQSAGKGYDSGYRYGDADRAGVMEGAVSNYRNGDYGSPDEALRLFGYKPTDAETGAGSSYGSLTRKFGQSDLDGDLVYKNGLQFGLDEGRKGIERQQQASGGLLSGATLKALSRFGNDYGTTKTEGAYNRFNTDNTNIYNRLAGIAGSGQTASAQVGSAGQNYANNVSQTAQGLGNARAASGIASANAISGGLQGAYNNYQGGQMLKQLQNPSWQSSTYNAGSEPYPGYNASVGLG